MHATEHPSRWRSNDNRALGIIPSGLWLTANVKNATLITTEKGEEAKERFMAEKIDALAGLRPGQLDDLKKMPGTRILDGKFAEVQQAIGTLKTNTAAIPYLHDFVEDCKASGLVASMIEKHGVTGRLSVAAPG